MLFLLAVDRGQRGGGMVFLWIIFGVVFCWIGWVGGYEGYLIGMSIFVGLYSHFEIKLDIVKKEAVL